MINRISSQLYLNRLTAQKNLRVQKSKSQKRIEWLRNHQKIKRALLNQSTDRGTPNISFQKTQEIANCKLNVRKETNSYFLDLSHQEIQLMRKWFKLVPVNYQPMSPIEANHSSSPELKMIEIKWALFHLFQLRKKNRSIKLSKFWAKILGLIRKQKKSGMP